MMINTGDKGEPSRAQQPPVVVKEEEMMQLCQMAPKDEELV